MLGLLACQSEPTLSYKQEKKHLQWKGSHLVGTIGIVTEMSGARRGHVLPGFKGGHKKALKIAHFALHKTPCKFPLLIMLQLNLHFN